MTYQEWLNAVTTLCDEQLGFPPADIPQVNFAELYQTNLTPQQAVDNAIATHRQLLNNLLLALVADIAESNPPEE